MATATQTLTPIRLFEIAGKVVLIKQPWLDDWAKTRACGDACGLLKQWLTEEHLAFLANERWIKTPAVSNSNTPPLPDGEQRTAWGRLSRDDEDRVIVAMLQKTKVKDIALRFRVGESTVRRIQRRRGPTAETIQKVLFLHNRNEHIGVAGIVEATGTSPIVAEAIIQNYRPLTRSEE